MNTSPGQNNNDPGSVAPTEALGRLEAGDYAGAIVILERNLATDATGQCLAWLGLAHFQLEHYAAAVRYYEGALRQDDSQSEWRHMLEKARENQVAEIQVHVPEVHYFQREELIGPAIIAPGELPAPPSYRTPIWPEKVRRTVGSAFGLLATALMDATTHVWGWIAGYQDQIWTNWYRRPLSLGILTLAYMRERLNRDNLINTYNPGDLTGFQPGGQTPPPGVMHFRTADGSWNNLDNPKEGAAGTRFLRNIPASAVKPETGKKLLTPNPREISRHLLARQGPMREVPFLNLLAAAWIQFETHDWINHGEMLGHDVHEILLASDDPARQKYHQLKLFVGKTQPDPTRSGAETAPVAHINEVTHWWDASQIYGSDLKTQHQLRSFVGGELRLNPDGTLPLDKNGVETTGFQRNWWVGLSLLHTLFVREHNAICTQLRIFHPQWEDNRLFNVARLINAAVIAKIHTVEWTPAILPNPALNTSLNANWFGLLTNLCNSGKDRRTLSEIKIANPELGGVVGNPRNRHGQPYGLTEEFVEVYRLHSLLPETLKLQKIGQPDSASEISLPASRQAGSPKLAGVHGHGNLLYSFGNQHPGQLVLNNYPNFMRELSIPGNPVFDMGAVDILRARERGIPRYNEFRRNLGLNPIRTFRDLTDDPAQVEKLSKLYGYQPGDVENLDLMIGTLAEGHRPSGFGFGETMFQIFILNATRRLQADRFYTDNYNAATYTREGLEWIDNATLKSVLLRHYPELAKTGLANVTNAFEPWDTAQNLDPERHPLRRFDPELKANPWRGDAFRTSL